MTERFLKNCRLAIARPTRAYGPEIWTVADIEPDKSSVIKLEGNAWRDTVDEPTTERIRRKGPTELAAITSYGPNDTTAGSRNEERRKRNGCSNNGMKTARSVVIPRRMPGINVDLKKNILKVWT